MTDSSDHDSPRDDPRAASGPDDVREMPFRVGRYHVIGMLGEGGMGIVYEAEQEQPLRHVAVKVVKPHLSTRHLRRFELEAEVLGRLRHPGIAHIYEAGVEEVHYRSRRSMQPYLAMELIEGSSLAEHASGLDHREKLALVARICDAVQYAHRRGVVHRDLKPANILVDRNGQPKVLDFGVARAVDADTPEERTKHTRVGELVGTLPYMSPEQLEGDVEAIDTQTDVYALGVVLYELLTGRHPYEFENGSLAEISARIDSPGFPLPSKFDRSLRGDVDVIVATAIEDEKERRYESPAALAADIRRHLRLEPIQARAHSGWYVARRQLRRHRIPVTLGALFLIALSTFAIVSWSLFVSARDAKRLAEEQREEARERLWESYLASARLGRESRLPGRRIESLEVIARAREIRSSPELRDEAIATMALTDLREVRQLAGVTGANATGLDSLDRFAWVENDTVSVVTELATGRRLATLPGPGGRVWKQRFSPDGGYLAAKYIDAGPGRDAWVWDLSTGERALAIDGQELDGPGMAFDPASRLIAFTAADSSIRLYELGSDVPVRSIPNVGAASLVAFDPARPWLATFADDAVRLWHVEHGHQLTSSHVSSHLYALEYSPDGHWLAGAAFDGAIYVWDGSSGNLVRTLRGHASAVTFVYFGSHDLLASQSWDGTSRVWDLRRGVQVFDPIQELIVVGMAGDRILFTEHQRRVIEMEIVADTELTYITCDSDFRGAGQIDVDRSDRLLATSADNGLYLWSLESFTRIARLAGRASDVLFVDDRLYATIDGELWCWTVRDDSGEVRVGEGEHVAAEHAVDFLDLNPDGRSLLTIHRPFLVTLDLESGAIRDSVPVPHGAEHPKISADGRWVFLGNWRGVGGHAIDRRTGEVKRQFPGSSVVGDLSPDGHTLLVAHAQGYYVVDVPSFQDRVQIPCPERHFTGTVAFDPSGDVAAVAYSRYVVWLLDLRTGERLCKLRNPELEPITALRFCDRGKRLIALSAGREILVWDLAGIRRNLHEIGLDWEP